MKLEDFYPVNKWSTVDPERYNVDKTTGRHYPYLANKELKLRSAAISAITPVIHIAAAVAFIGLRTIRLISFWHFWKPQAKSLTFKAQLKDAGKDLLKIVSHPFSILALGLLSLYGPFRPQDWRKLYCSIEEFQYDRHLLMSYLDLAPETPDIPKPTQNPEPDDVEEEPIPEPPPLPEPTPVNPPPPDNTNPPVNPPINPPTDPKNPPVDNPEIPNGIELPMVIVPEIKGVISDTIKKFPNTMPERAMKDSITAAIVQHIVDYVPHVNISQVINDAPGDSKEPLKENKIRLRSELTPSDIQEKLVKRILKETFEDQNAALFKNILSAQGNDDIKAVLAKDLSKEFQEDYVQNFEEMNQLIIDYIPQKGNDSTAVDAADAAASDEDEEKGPEADPFAVNMANTAKLNELLDLFNEEGVIKKLGVDIVAETKKALLKSKLKMELFKKLAAMPNFDPVKVGVAQAIVAIGECLNKTKGDSSLSIDEFLDCCQIVLQTLKTGDDYKSLDNPKDLFLFVYLVNLRGIYNDAVTRVQKTMENRMKYKKDQADTMGDLTSKINVMLDMDIEFKVEMAVADDELCILIASIPNITATVDQITQWLISKSELDKVAFKAWLQRKADNGYQRLFGIKSNLDVLEDMFRSKI